MTGCINVPASGSIRFLTFGRQPVFADFTGQQLSSHGGALLPREAKKNSPKLVQRLAASLPIRAWSVMRILPRLSSGWPPAHFAQARGVKN